MHRAIKPDPHHLCDAACIVAVRFVSFSIVLRVRGVRAALALSLKFDGALAMLLALCSSAARLPEHWRR
jgi:hypothetical protein